LSQSLRLPLHTMQQDLDLKETVGPARLQDLNHGRRHQRQDGQNLGRDRQPEDETMLLIIFLFSQEDGKA
jgi:hypothetical protein